MWSRQTGFTASRRSFIISERHIPNAGLQEFETSKLRTERRGEGQFVSIFGNADAVVQCAHNQSKELRGFDSPYPIRRRDRVMINPHDDYTFFLVDCLGLFAPRQDVQEVVAVGYVGWVRFAPAARSSRSFALMVVPLGRLQLSLGTNKTR